MPQTLRPTTTVTVVPTGALSVGDIVHLHGVRVRLAADVTAPHHVDGNGGGKVRAFKTVYLGDLWPTGIDRSFHALVQRGEWNLQGNNFASWAREVAPPRSALPHHHVPATEAAS